MCQMGKAFGINLTSTFEPVTDEHVGEIINLFKDENLIFIKFESIYKLVFGNNNEHSRTKWSNANHLKNVLLQFFPFMFISFFNNEFILDMTKLDHNMSGLVESLLYFIDYDDLYENEKEVKEGRPSEIDMRVKVEGEAENRKSEDTEMKQENLANNIGELNKSLEELLLSTEPKEIIPKLEETEEIKTEVRSQPILEVQDRFSHLKSF